MMAVDLGDGTLGGAVSSGMVFLCCVVKSVVEKKVLMLLTRAVGTEKILRLLWITRVAAFCEAQSPMHNDAPSVRLIGWRGYCCVWGGGTVTEPATPSWLTLDSQADPWDKHMVFWVLRQVNWWTRKVVFFSPFFFFFLPLAAHSK